MKGYQVNDKLEKMLKEAVVANLFGGTYKNREEPQSGYPVSGPGFEPDTSRIRSRIVNSLGGTE
jgi:hypothetical protein